MGHILVALTLMTILATMFCLQNNCLSFGDNYHYSHLVFFLLLGGADLHFRNSLTPTHFEIICALLHVQTTAQFSLQFGVEFATGDIT